MPRNIAARVAPAYIRYREAGCPAPHQPTDAEFEPLLAFLAGDAAKDYLSLAVHELNVSGDVSVPCWKKCDIAANREFRVAIVGANPDS